MQEVRIIGGQNINIDQAPWQVLFEINGNDDCGGVVLNTEWILTAAHCVVIGGATPQNSRIIAGITLRSQKNNGQIRNISQIIVHDDYNTVNNDNDMALIKLSTPLSFNQDVQSVPFATDIDVSSGLLDPGVIATITGWGWIDDFGNRPNHLQAANLPIISNQEAIDLGSNVTANMIALFQQGVAAAPGDSGGPMVVPKNGGVILGGICSWGHFPKSSNPTIYTRVSNYCNWIMGHIVEITGPDLLCTSDTYTVTNLPAGATVTGWSVSPTGAVWFSGTGNSRTVTRSTPYNGFVTLSTTIATACGTMIVNKRLYAGRVLDYFIDGPTSIGTGWPGTYFAENTFQPGMGITSWNWFFAVPPPVYSITPVGPGVAEVIVGTPGSYTLAVSVTNPCGASEAKTLDIEVGSGGGVGGLSTVYLNPEDKSITVSLPEELAGDAVTDKGNIKPFVVVLYDDEGNQVGQESGKDGTARFDIRGLSGAKYRVQINQGERIESHEVVVKH